MARPRSFSLFVPTASFEQATRVRTSDGAPLIRREVPLGGRPLDRAVREIAALEELRHAAILEHVSHEVSAGRLFALTRFVDGATLAQFIKRRAADRRPLSDEQVLQYFHQICLGLRCLHARGLIHRDVHPANVLVLSDGLVTLVGFDSVRLAGDDRLGMAGSYPFIAPEMWDGKYDTKVDIWSAGCIFYEMCTFRRAFATRVDEVKRAHQCRALPDMRPMKSRPRGFRDLLRRMLDYDAARRLGATQVVRTPVMRAYFNLLVAENAAAQTGALGKSARRADRPVARRPPRDEFLVSWKDALAEDDGLEDL
jgi:NIMA (never in mitosis gene a)-related kinase